jgi:hypothetical protein
MSKILEKDNIDLKNISVYNFLEILNSQWIIEKYYDNLVDVEIEYFTKEEEKEMDKTFSKLNNLIDKKF